MTGLYTRATDGIRVTVRESWTPERLLVCAWDGPCVSRTLQEVSDLIITRQIVPRPEGEPNPFDAVGFLDEDWS